MSDIFPQSLWSIPTDMINMILDFSNVTFCNGKRIGAVKCYKPDFEVSIYSTMGQQTFYKSKFYIISHLENMLHVFDVHGRFEKSWRVVGQAFVEMRIADDEIFIVCFNNGITVYDLDGKLKRTFSKLNSKVYKYTRAFFPFDNKFLVVLQCEKSMYNHPPFLPLIVDNHGKILSRVQFDSNSLQFVMWVDPMASRFIACSCYGSILLFIDNRQFTLHLSFLRGHIAKKRIFVSPLNEIFFVDGSEHDNDTATLHICDFKKISDQLSQNTIFFLDAADRTVTLDISFKNFLNLIFLEDGLICCICLNNMCYFYK